MEGPGDCGRLLGYRGSMKAPKCLASGTRGPISVAEALRGSIWCSRCGAHKLRVHRAKREGDYDEGTITAHAEKERPSERHNPRVPGLTKHQMKALRWMYQQTLEEREHRPDPSTWATYGVGRFNGRDKHITFPTMNALESLGLVASRGAVNTYRRPLGHRTRTYYDVQCWLTPAGESVAAGISREGSWL